MAAGGRGKKLIAGVIAAAAIGGGGIWWQSRRRPARQTRSRREGRRRAAAEAGRAPDDAAAGHAHAHAAAPVAAQPPRRSSCGWSPCRPARRWSTTSTAQLLGMTPLVLTRPRGGTLTLRFEKDGYSASTRTMALDGDRAFELTLEQKPKKTRA